MCADADEAFATVDGDFFHDHAGGIAGAEPERR